MPESDKCKHKNSKNKHTRKPTVDLFEMSFLGNMDHNYSIGVDC